MENEFSLFLVPSTAAIEFEILGYFKFKKIEPYFSAAPNSGTWLCMNSPIHSSILTFQFHRQIGAAGPEAEQKPRALYLLPVGLVNEFVTKLCLKGKT